MASKSEKNAGSNIEEWLFENTKRGSRPYTDLIASNGVS